MKLDLKTQKNICGKIFRRYQKAGKKGKGEILDEYTAKPPVKSRKKTSGIKKMGRPEKYDKAFVKVLADIWDFSTLNAGNSWLPCLGGHRLFGP